MFSQHFAFSLSQEKCCKPYGFCRKTDQSDIPITLPLRRRDVDCSGRVVFCCHEQKQSCAPQYNQIMNKESGSVNVTLVTVF